MVYALRSNTNGKTQPYDTGLFSVFKMEVKRAISDVSNASIGIVIDFYKLCSIRRHAYHSSFTRQTIIASVAKSVLWTVGETKLLSTLHPRDSEKTHFFVSIEDMRCIFLNNIEQTRRSIVSDEILRQRRRFVDTTKGIVLMTDRCLELVRAKSVEHRQKKLAAQRKKI